MRASLFAAIVLACALPGSQEPADAWEFALGQPTERLDATVDALPATRTSVKLPHRIHAPNTSMWYVRDLDIRPGSAIEVVADDGAQVFVGRRRLDNYRRWFAVPMDLGGRQRVAVRVMNNAMQGGLRRVAVVDGTLARAPALEAVATPPGFARVDSDLFQRRMPGATGECPFTAWADSQSGWPVFSRIVERMRQRTSAFSVGVGDLVADGSDPDAWPAFVKTLMPLARTTPIVPIAGNHDYDGFYNRLRAERYEATFDRRDATWFAWSCGPLRLAAVDLNREFPIGISEGSPQWRWLEAETTSPVWTGARWRILLAHQPPWSKSWAGYNGDESIRHIVERLAESRGLDVVIAGHSHAYEHLVRSTGLRRVHVFITGGAGGALEDAAADALSTPRERIATRHHFVHVSANASTLTFEAMDVDGALIDRVVLRR